MVTLRKTKSIFRFQGEYILFVLSFEDEVQGTNYKCYYLLIVEMKNHGAMINRRNFDQPVKHKLMTHDSVQKIAAGQGDDYTTGCLLAYNYFKNCYKVIAIDLSKQQALDADLKARHQINFTGNLAQQAAIFFITEEAKEALLDFLILFFVLT